MKLNVGCGEFYVDGWMNIDIGRDQDRRPDVVADVTQLPHEIRDLEKIYCGHVLEHLELNVVESALRDLRERSVPGGEIVVVGPDAGRARMLHAAGAIDQETLDGAIHGANRWDGDAHTWECTEDTIVRVLRAAGWEGVRGVDVHPDTLDGWPIVSYARWQCAVTGWAPR